ncbi:MAG TPA: hypothetical protein VF103_05625, partial [Polyangiaceae bacterium]
MTRLAVRTAFAAVALFALGACGETAGSVLAPIPEHPADGASGGGTGMPPGSNLRVDAFLVRDVSSVAIGEPCGRNNDPDMRMGGGDCFEFEDSSGAGIAFRSDTLDFVAPDE